MRRAASICMGAFALAGSSMLSCSGGLPSDRSTRAERVHQRAVVVDAHVHPKAGDAKALSLGERSDAIEIDFLTMKEGGLDAAFFSVPFLGDQRGMPDSARIFADVRAIRDEVERFRDLAEVALSASDVRRIQYLGKRAVLLGIEARDPIGGDPGVLERYHSAGIRMITLSPSLEGTPGPAADDAGNLPLGPVGRRVIEEMNRLGMIIDISHVPDRQQMDAIRASAKPVVASHSNVRALNPVSRQIPDSIIVAMSERGGVICVTFYPGHVSRRYPDEPATVEELVDHIDHLVRVAGVDHVGFGSDFLGGDAHTRGLESAAGLPSLTRSLLDRGYSSADIEKILGGNVLRVLEVVGGSAAGNGAA